MKIFASFINNYIDEISTTKLDGSFDEYEVEDLDFFNNYRFYTASPDKKLVLSPRYKKLEQNEYLLVKTDGGTLILLKPFIEAVDATFIKFETEDEKNEALMHLNHYFYFDDNTKTLEIDESKKEMFVIENHKEAFREYREMLFKKWDIIKTNSLIGLADPLTQEEKDWYVMMLDYTTQITENSTPET